MHVQWNAHRAEKMDATRSWLLLLCLAAAGVLQARAQPDSIGFINIDCGLPGTESFVDEATGLSYSPDDAFIDTGSNNNISTEYVTPEIDRGFHNLRSFPDGARNCYTLRSLVAGLKYTIRTYFMYGNYDGLNKPPVFDVHIGVNFWRTVNASNPGIVWTEATVVVPNDFVQVCLVNTGSGTPFISGLELRPLNRKLYPQVNATQGLVLLDRVNFGPTNGTAIIRYPDDPHDRLWIPLVDTINWAEISTNETVRNINNDLFEAPSKVMQTAIKPRNSSQDIELSWSEPMLPPNKDPSPGYIIVMHFSELQELHGAARQFYINLNSMYLDVFTTTLLYSEAVYSTIPFQRGYTKYTLSLNATENSTLPPIINALEIFSVIPTSDVGTDPLDVSAIVEIKDKYNVQKNWMGDPCLPKTLAWNGLTCSYSVSSPPRITSLNLSLSGLNGDISASFANLKAIQYLDLSNNSLTGSIPDALSQLSSLVVLDLTGNQLTGAIPAGLQRRIQDGSLSLKYGNNPNLCTDGKSCEHMKKESKLTTIYISVPIGLVVVIVALLLGFLRWKRQGSTKKIVKPQDESTKDGHLLSALQHKNRQFTYSELKTITKNFNNLVGKGGFGKVYDGVLEDDTRVAVKLRPQSPKESDQAEKQFIAEVEILTWIHHRNLVSMIGYCKDTEYMALVYEYISEGTLQDHIAGKGGRYLTWRQRLRVALESAQGLEYLHKGCNPPFVHRDVKLANILLNERLEAKIADFGLSKVFNGDKTHLSMNTIAGTPGYIDPEYYRTSKLTTKSDVYSFGVVLLELVIGRPLTLHGLDATKIIEWVQQCLACGNIEDIMDVRMHDDNHDINSVWKAIRVGLKCTIHKSIERPNMTNVVEELQECLALEEAHDDGTGTGIDRRMQTMTTGPAPR